MVTSGVPYEEEAVRMRGRIVTVVTLALLLIVGCSHYKVVHNSELEASIFSIVEKEENKVVEVAALTDFDWDKAFLLPPYTTQEWIAEQLGTDLKDPGGISMRDDIYVLVFLRGQEVIHYAEIERQQCDFSLGGQGYLTPTNAMMYIQRD